MDLRRDALVDQPSSTALTSSALRRVPSYASYAGRDVFRSGSPQRPVLVEPIPKILWSNGQPISTGGRHLGPTSYDLPAPWKDFADKKSSQFVSSAPRLHPLPRSLSAELDFFEPCTDLHPGVSSHAPLSKGRVWPTSPRSASPPPREPGLEHLTDPELRSISAEVEHSSRHYRPSFKSHVDRFSLPKQPSVLGPGERQSDARTRCPDASVPFRARCAHSSRCPLCSCRRGV